MACNSCGKKKKTCDNKEFTKAVVEINNPETNVLIRKVVIPASIGDDNTNPPVVGKYCNVVLFYEANWHVYLYSSDGIPTLISDNGDVDFDRIQNRPWYNGAPMTSDTRIPKVPSAVSELNNDRNYQTASQVSNTVSNAVAAEANIRQGADETLRNDIDAEVLARQNAITTLTNKINRDVMYDLEMSTSAQSVSFKEDKVNVVTGATSTEIDTIPAASSTTAGIITAAEYTTLVDSEEKIEALLNGAVAITGLPSTPTQAELTTTWKNATGRDTLINRASIFDVDNQLVWTYYTNVDTWESAPSGQVSVSQFGNGTPGIITGSTIDGNVSANLDGTGTVSGWTTVKNDIATNTAAIATKANITDIPTVNNATLTIQKNGSNVATFTANSATNTTANIAVPTVDPEDFFTSNATDSDKGNPLYFEGTIEKNLDNIILEGDTDQTAYSGKNKLNLTNYGEHGVNGTVNSDGTVTISGTANSSGGYQVFYSNQTIPAGTYTMTISKTLPFLINFSIASGVSFRIPAGTTSITTTLDTSYSTGTMFMAMTNGTTYNETFQIQITAGSSADTDFEPYVGGTASPNPDYPQEIKVVTGEQTISITDDDEQSQEYIIDLGDTELCKIGGYQDHFYKDGDDWYIHKEIAKTTLSDLTWGIEANASNYRLYSNNIGNFVVKPSTNNQKANILSNIYTVITASETWTATTGKGISIDTTGNIRLYDDDYNTSSSLSSFTTMLSNKDTVFYYALATPTDTKITDSSLIEQLDTLWNGAHSYDGETWLSAQSNGVDLPFILDVTVVRDGLAGLRQIIDEKQDQIIAGSNITITDNVVSATVPTVNNATLTIQENGTNVATFTANSSTNATANITVPTITMTSVDPGEGSPLAANNFIAVYEA